jgi:hypothetical protein
MFDLLLPQLAAVTPPKSSGSVAAAATQSDTRPALHPRSKPFRPPILYAPGWCPYIAVTTSGEIGYAQSRTGEGSL